MADKWTVFSQAPAQPDNWQSPTQEQAPAPSWSEVPGLALSNALPSAGKYATGIGQMIMHPIDTTGNLMDAAAGGLRNITPNALANFLDKMDKPEDTARIEATAKAVGNELSNRYGGMENIRRTLATDPFGAGADAASILSLGSSSAASIPTLARGARAVQNVAKWGDPLYTTARGVGAIGEKIAPPLLGMTTGSGTSAVREAARTGYAGGVEGQAFRDSIRGVTPSSNVVDAATDSVAALREQRGSAYRTDMKALAQDPTVLDFAPVDQAIQKVAGVGKFKGKNINEEAAPTWEKINAKVNEWRTDNPADFHTVEGMDALKQAIGNIRAGEQYGTPGRIIADEVYHAIRKQIVTQAPGYARVMSDYESASELLNNLGKTLSMNPTASVDTQLRKLQSILRNNANTNYGARVQLGESLVNSGALNANTIMPQLAGQLLSSPTPRGLATVGAGAGAVAALATNPFALPALAATSPRLVGETVNAGGRAARLAEQLANMGPVSPQVKRALAIQLSRFPQKQDNNQ